VSTAADSQQQAPQGIEPVAVSAWFVEHVPDIVLPLTFSLIAGGHSNLTYRVQDSSAKVLVLRRPPTGHVLATAHDMAREHKIVSGIGGSAVPVPATIGLCEDVAVNAAPFYVMDFVSGPVLHNDETAGELTLTERKKLSDHVIDVLGALHSLDPDVVGLGDLGRREDYIGRQLRRWSRQWEQSKTRELIPMDDAHRLLEERVPEQIGAAIVHGDYRLGNMICNQARVSAVLDWELCTLGDPMADVGYLMNNWVSPGETLSGTSGPTAAGGFATRDHLLGRYADATGRDVANVDYYRAFSHWRLAAIVEGVLNRYLAGSMGDQDGDTQLFKMQVEHLAASAMDLLSS